MLEIILIFVFAKRIGAIVERKGRRRFPYQAMLVAFWIGGEIGGAILGTAVALILSNGRNENFAMSYMFALGGAALGAIVSFVIANSVSSLRDDRRDWGDVDLSKFEARRRSSREDISPDRRSSYSEPEDGIRQ